MFDLFHKLCTSDEPKQETQGQCDCEQYAQDDSGSFPNLSAAMMPITREPESDEVEIHLTSHYGILDRSLKFFISLLSEIP